MRTTSALQILPRGPTGITVLLPARPFRTRQRVLTRRSVRGSPFTASLGATLFGAGEPGRRRLTLHPLAREGYLVVPSDRIHKATVEALAPGAIRPLPLELQQRYGVRPDETFWVAYPFASGRTSNRIQGVIGFRREPDAAVWKLLQQNPALAVKAQYALWARAYAEAAAEAGTSPTISIPQFCDDLGYARLPNGAHKPERKRAAMAVLKLLTSLELCGTYASPHGAVRRLQGPLWARGVIDDPGGRYADLFDAARCDCLAERGPVAFAYSAGLWFFDPVWRKYNPSVARVGEGLLRLSSRDNDKWAVLVGGYVATLARMCGYEPRTLRVAHLLERSGLLRAERRNPARMLDKLEKALDRVAEVGVIGGWEYAGGRADEPDMDHPAALAVLADAAQRRAEQRIVIRWPAALAARATWLREARTAHAVARMRRRKARAPREDGRDPGADPRR
jgi:hypothetical protein